MIRHAVLAAVAVAAISLTVLSSPVQAQDEPPPARTTEDLLAAIEAVRAKLRALDEPVDIRTSTEQELADLRDRAEAGDTEAQVRVLALYAEQGNAQAQFGTAIGYANGFGVPLDYSKAAAWYRRAAEQGHADGQLMLGLGYATGEGVPQDYSEAAAWYRKAAEQNEATAQYKLGQTYHHGLGVPQDYAEAITWYRQAAEQGNADAQINLGLMYGRTVMTSAAAAGVGVHVLRDLLGHKTSAMADRYVRAVGAPVADARRAIGAAMAAAMAGEGGGG